MEKHYYVYYHKASNREEHDDVAICEAESVHAAVEKFKEFYLHVSEKEVRKVDLHRDGYVSGMMIISEY